MTQGPGKDKGFIKTEEKAGEGKMIFLRLFRPAYYLWLFQFAALTEEEKEEEAEEVTAIPRETLMDMIILSSHSLMGVAAIRMMSDITAKVDRGQDMVTTFLPLRK